MISSGDFHPLLLGVKQLFEGGKAKATKKRARRTSTIARLATEQTTSVKVG
jgi:hypothetical protein